MKLIYHKNSKQGGVYKITNKQNGKFYIGSAKCFQVRASQHVSSLKNNKHKNYHLQASWNLYGSEAFIFEAIEVVNGDKETRYEVEQRYIDQIIKEGKWEETFNFKKKAIQKERTIFSKSPEKTKIKLSKAQKRLWQDPEERKKRIEGRDGKRREKIGKASKKAWKSMSQDDKENLANKRKQLTAEQWKDPEIRKRRIEGLKNTEGWDALRKRLTVISPEGKEVEVVGIGSFCKKHNLNRRTFGRVLAGVFSQHKGWKVKK